MQCPVCAALNQDRCAECEIEAKATLQERELVANGRTCAHAAVCEHLDSIVLASRMRQLRITQTLETHIRKAHAA